VTVCVQSSFGDPEKNKRLFLRKGGNRILVGRYCKRDLQIQVGRALLQKRPTNTGWQGAFAKETYKYRLAGRFCKRDIHIQDGRALLQKRPTHSSKQGAFAKESCKFRLAGRFCKRELQIQARSELLQKRLTNSGILVCVTRCILACGVTHSSLCHDS